MLAGVKLDIVAGARIGLLGANGAGKSTLIKLLAGHAAPLAGERRVGKGLKVGYFAQHQLEQLRPDESPLQHMLRADPSAREQDLRDYLGGFDFRAATVDAPAHGVLLSALRTLNNLMLPSVARFLYQLRGLRPKNRIVGAFGAYGWGGGGVKESYEEFKKMGLEIVEPGLQILYRPSSEDEAKCYDFGKMFAPKVKENHALFH